MSKNDTSNELNLSKELNELRETIGELVKAYAQNVEDKLEKVPAYLRKEEEQLAKSVQEHPLKGIGIAAFIGFILGAILCRK